MNQDELNKAVKEWNKLTAERARANRVAKDASKAAAEAKDNVEAILGERGYEGVKVSGSLVSLYDLPHYHVQNRDKFGKWAAKQDEAYFEPEKRIRQELVDKICNERSENGEGLPPGVVVHLETKISKRKA